MPSSGFTDTGGTARGSTIVELSPVLTRLPASAERLFENRHWHSTRAMTRRAQERGHTYQALPEGAITEAVLDEALAGADAVVVAPPVVPGAPPPAAGRTLGQRILSRVARQSPAAHVVLVSHFIVGHGRAHHAAQTGSWVMRDLEYTLRAHSLTWTILRPTWHSTAQTPTYRPRLMQHPLADGLVSTASIAATVVAAIENPADAGGTTSAVYDEPVEVEPPDLSLVAHEFRLLEKDPESLREVAHV